MRDLERVAIVDHLSAGGVSRFLMALICHLGSLYPQTEFTYFVSQMNVDRDSLEQVFSPYPNVVLAPINGPHMAPYEPPSAEPVQRGAWWSVPVSFLKRYPRAHKTLLGAWERIRGVIRKLISPPPPLWWQYRLPVEVVRCFAEYDVVYHGWPYFLGSIVTPTPIVATFHDFHYRHFPGSYPKDQLKLVEKTTSGWLRSCTTAICSTRFIRDELLAFYPADAPPIEVVYLAAYGFHRPTPEAIDETLGRLGIQHPYALFSGGRSTHKNLVAIVEAIGILRKRGAPVHLVITGLGADAIGLPSQEDETDPIHRLNELIEEYELKRFVDYFPLGYVSNEDVDALTAGADVSVSASLYEAGCGPAMDAWLVGVPVAFSAIPPFLEQMERFGVEAWVFDPHDPEDVAEKIGHAVFDKETTAAMVEKSLHAFDQYTWDDVARGYYDVFLHAAQAKRVTGKASSLRRRIQKGRRA
ncbi:MAG: glycosyltransferase [Coriobacteriia bacterium]